MLVWNTIHPWLHATTILGQCPTVAGTFCNLCRECNHTATHCALNQLQQSTICVTTRASSTRPAQRRICSSWKEGLCMHLGSCSYWNICSNCFHLLSRRARDCHAPPGLRSSTYIVPQPPPLIPAENSDISLAYLLNLYTCVVPVALLLYLITVIPVCFFHLY